MAFSSPAPIIASRLVRFDELSLVDLDAWSALIAEAQAYDSALLMPEFGAVISQIRDDVRIAIISQGKRFVAVLPVHLRPGGLARPLGAPFSDYSGPIISPSADLNLEDILNLTGLPAFESATSVTPYPDPTTGDTALEHHVIRPGDMTADEYIESRRQKHAKRFKNFRRLAKQFEREVGPLQLEWGRPSNSFLTQLFQIKSRQFAESGYLDITSSRESRRILDAVAASEYGFCISLWSGDELVSGHFGFRAGDSFHPWIAAFEPKWAPYSPGNLLLLNVLKHWDEMGLDCYDLATGHDHYKKYFANSARPTTTVFATGDGFQAQHRKLWHDLWVRAGAMKDGSLTGRLKRRMDQIAASEFNSVARMVHFLDAVKARAAGTKA
ncbi:GNAT family N-acetyltransferase [Henriciella sp. AS95]|uniref:GNAT family N-acetyltransferase n=1 Tax=Henriciella sp. AS95 TaxID=3135782 RepID=UPI00316C5BA2